jgi:tRNA(Ile)-lysidine synthase TilS/MesJ
MQICTKCILDENFPGIRFDENGVCIYCRQHKKKEELQALKEKYERKFTDIIEKYKGKSSYDCVVAFSGGKDSTYTLHLLKNIYKLNILALSYDNWFQSQTALENIDRVAQNLEIDLIKIKPNYDVFKKIMRTTISHDVYSIKALERASSICTTCISLIRFMCFKIAVEKEIPFVIFGMSPGQAPVVTSVVKTNPEMIRKMQDIIFQPLHKDLGDAIFPHFLEERHCERTEFFPYSINPLAFSRYDEKEILEIVKSLGWRKPEDTDPNSTNCLLNSLANHLHKEKFNFNPYVYELAELVREGNLDRDAAMAKINTVEDMKTIEQVKNKLGIE